MNAVYGYLDMVSYLLTARRPVELVHAYDDDWRPAPRVAIYDGYKANRQPDPEPLPWQFVLLRELLDAAGMSQAEAPGWEAEDAIGSLIAQQGDREPATDIVTGDRDLIQLVRDPGFASCSPAGGAQVAEYDEAGVLAKYGVPADRVRGLRDAARRPLRRPSRRPRGGREDGPGAGQAYPARGAAGGRRGPHPDRPLLQRSPRLRVSVRDSADYLRSMQRIVPIRTDLELRAWKPEFDEDRLRGLARQHNLNGPVNRLLEAFGRVR